MSWTYANVDRSGDPAAAAEWMDTMASWPSIRSIKQRTVDLLRGGAPVLDVGCGVGNEVRALGDGAVGLDSSSTMLREARARGGRFVRGDVHALPFASGALEGVRTERTLQHVTDPATALQEIRRVLRSGGRVVCAEPDQSTLVIEGTDLELTAAIVSFRAGSVRNGLLAGQLARRLSRLGFVDVQRESFTVEITDPALAFGLPSWPSMIVERGAWNVDEARRFTASLESPSFSYRFDVVVTWATR
ncbi:MAG TPA: methyltransferase domain-containing protein [Acidimicrobiales bacterium]